MNSFKKQTTVFHSEANNQKEAGEVKQSIFSSGQSIRHLVPESRGRRLSITIDMNSVFYHEVVQIKGYNWQSPVNFRDASREAECFMHAVYNGFNRLALQHLGEIQNLILYDESQEVVQIARKAGIKAKLFALTDYHTSRPVVQGRHFDWEIVPIEQTDRTIPLEILRDASKMKQLGVEFEGYSLALPIYRPRKIHFDPVLLGYKRGYNGLVFWLEIGRWL